MQHAVVHRYSGTFTNSELVTIPGLRRIISLRYMLRRAREKRFSYNRLFLK
jgi:hypothetical protein